MTLPDLSAKWPGRDAESLLWLASYPRSGNTFTRILLANYFASDGEAYDINKLADFITADISNSVWQGSEAGLPAGKSIEAIWKGRPSAIASYRRKIGRQSLPGLKTHNANIPAFGVSGFDFRPSDRALYIVRHPLDLLLSLADYNAKDIDSAIAMMTIPGYILHTETTGELEVRGSWTEHVASWLNTPPCPILLVRYEDLCSDTETTLRSILTYLKVPIVEERVHHAVAASRFEKLREQEAARSFREAPADTKSGRFFREGKSLQWLRKLHPAQAYKLADACEAVMVRLGYSHPRDVLFDGRNAFRPIQLGGQNLKPDSISSL